MPASIAPFAGPPQNAPANPAQPEGPTDGWAGTDFRDR